MTESKNDLGQAELCAAVDAYLRDFERYPGLTVMIKSRFGLPFKTQYGAAQWSPVATGAHEVAAHYLPRILTTMGHAHKHPEDAIAILAGLGVNNCWGACLERDEDAYILAASLVRFVENKSGSSMFLAAKPVVCKILNDWLDLATTWGKLPTAQTLCEAMFGAILVFQQRATLRTVLSWNVQLFVWGSARFRTDNQIYFRAKHCLALWVVNHDNI